MGWEHRLAKRQVRVAVGLMIISIVAAAMPVALGLNYWWQRAPGVLAAPGQNPPPAPPGPMVEHCDLLVANPTNVSPGSSGQVSFYCADNSAFATAAAVSAVPWFETEGFNPPYTALWVYRADGLLLTGSCSGRTDAVHLIHNEFAALSFGSWNYCAEYEDVGSRGLNAWAIGWYDRPCLPEDDCGDES